MGLTVKESKKFRCNHMWCNDMHFTCRRCEGHYSWQYQRGKTLLCETCHKDYMLWLTDNYLKRLIKEWEALPDVERQMWLDMGYSPMFYRNRYAEFIKKCPIITIESQKLLNGESIETFK